MSYQCKQPCLPPPFSKSTTICAGPGSTVCVSPTQGQSVEVCTSPTGAVCVTEGPSQGQVAGIGQDCCSSIVVSPVQSQAFAPGPTLCAKCNGTICVTQGQTQTQTQIQTQTQTQTLSQSAVVSLPQQKGCQCSVCQGNVSVQTQSGGASATICTSPGSSVCVTPISTPLGPATAVSTPPSSYTTVCQDPRGNVSIASKGGVKGGAKGTDPCGATKGVKACGGKGTGPCVTVSNDQVCVKTCPSISLNQCNTKKY